MYVRLTCAESSITKRVPKSILNLRMNNSVDLLRSKLYVWPKDCLCAIIRLGPVHCVGWGQRNSKFVSNFSIKFVLVAYEH
jgi:hypothetical protein